MTYETISYVSTNPLGETYRFGHADPSSTRRVWKSDRRRRAALVATISRFRRQHDDGNRDRRSRGRKTGARTPPRINEFNNANAPRRHTGPRAHVVPAPIPDHRQSYPLAAADGCGTVLRAEPTSADRADKLFTNFRRNVPVCVRQKPSPRPYPLCKRSVE